MGSDLFEPKLIQMSDNNVLTKQLIKNQLVSPNSAKSKDILVNLITCVDFSGPVSPKSCIVLQAPPLSTLEL
jgi:hypothetical protein